MGGEITCGYFDENFKIERKVDAFCTFQVFEHLEDVRNPLRKAASLLRPGGAGLINVPNGGQIMDSLLFHQVNFEHINYFTPNSLAYLCRECGLEVADLESDTRAIELNVYVRKRTRVKGMSEAERETAARLNQVIKNCERCAVYGAGAKTLYYGRLLDKGKVKLLLDGDARKAGRYIGGLEIPIAVYDKALLETKGIEAVIIFAASYNEEIIKKLKQDNFVGKIVYFDKDDVKTI